MSEREEKIKEIETVIDSGALQVPISACPYCKGPIEEIVFSDTAGDYKCTNCGKLVPGNFYKW